MKTGTLDPIANTATWQSNLELVDDATGSAFDMGDVAEITVRIVDPKTEAQVLEASLSGGGVVQVGSAADGVAQFTFSASEMGALCGETYIFSVLVTDDDGYVTQTHLCSLPVVKGY